MQNRIYIIYNHSKYNLMVYNRSICSNDNFLHLVFAIFLDRFCSDALVTMEMLIFTEKFNLNSYFTVILQVMRIKKYCRKCGFIFFSEDGRSNIFGQNFLNYVP